MKRNIGKNRDRIVYVRCLSQKIEPPKIKMVKTSMIPTMVGDRLNVWLSVGVAVTDSVVDVAVAADVGVEVASGVSVGAAVA